MPIKADKSLRAYYNEIDPFAAQWMRNLMAEGWITKGDVDERSIEDVQPNDLIGYDRLHFFAGVAVWDYALNQAGWGRGEIWTGSCPCQPFSAAGKGAGFDDERHLWPAFHHLIKECQPTAVLGEQVASKDSDPWIDLVHTDLEALGYAFGAIPFPASGVGAPHIRDRLYWVGHTDNAGLEGHPGNGRAAGRTGQSGSTAEAGVFGGLADNHGDRCPAPPELGKHCAEHHAESRGAAGGVADADSGQCEQQPSDERPAGVFGKTHAAQGFVIRPCDPGPGGGCGPGPTNGHWANADWLLCRDGRWRPVEPGTFPLAHGAPARVGRLRAYGNSINAKAGEVFIRAVMESIDAY